MPKKRITAASIAERITAVETELEALAKQTKTKKQELKELRIALDEENKAKVIAAFVNSGKTAEEAIRLLQADRDELPS